LSSTIFDLFYQLCLAHASGDPFSRFTAHPRSVNSRPVAPGGSWRGWTLDVLNVVRSLGGEDFSLADVYARSPELARLHPRNLHVHDKIRQQLQRLRDLGLVEFVGRGEYRIT
jgi:hypothetical protein